MRTDLLTNWLKGLRLAHIAHAQASSSDSWRHKVLGIPVVILTTIVGTTVFSNLGEVPSETLKIATGLLSIGAVVLSSLQTFLSYATSAERHRTVALKYGALRRELEQFLDDPPESKDAWTATVEEFRTRWDAVDQEAPAVRQGVWRNAKLQLDRSLANGSERDGAAVDDPA
ncbi:SLATT domain-containing protein [Lysobacter arenosi]|uniref:SLATT domain-containing protein n=1 Tax=Lysobacter arenosi TaxID=2795387 RepID=A0ABX7R7A4_9GAMM|nr:SLATT domain-containing protein [Lysobacter arenosi]QSX73998.1 SLATT domain-containing protein [Lysobacter arenosi]